MLYALIEKSCSEKLADEVNLRLKIGWELYGNPVVYWQYAGPQDCGASYCQAMIKKTN